jgi:hypothetical protein
VFSQLVQYGTRHFDVLFSVRHFARNRLPIGERCVDHETALERLLEARERIAALESLLRRIDAVTTWETTPLGRAFQEEIEEALNAP